MHADDTNYTAIKNGVLVVSGTGPAIRVDGNRLVVRDGPQGTPPLLLTRAEASRKLRHVIVCGNAGGFITFDAFRWLRDTRVAFSQLDWNGAIIITSGQRGVNDSALRRARVLVCSGVLPKTAAAITREILLIKVRGQAEVARLLGSADANEVINDQALAIARETDGTKALQSVEAHAAWLYWQQWKKVPVTFAHRNPQRLGPNGQWRPGRSDHWLTFGPRASLLTGKPFRATTPGNALLNYLYALLTSEMTVALNTVGLDPGIGMFHADRDGRPSLALDAIEAVRPHVDYWLFAYLASSAFANRDFTELPDGEIRLSYPLTSHLAHTAALWRKVCEPVANWLAQSLGRAVQTGTTMRDERSSIAQQVIPPKLLEPQPRLDPLILPALNGPVRHRWPIPLQRGLKDDPVPLACFECGKALVSRQRRFCSDDCTVTFSTVHQVTGGESSVATMGKVRTEHSDWPR